MPGFVASLRATWRTCLLRLAGAFVLLALLWLALAAVHAHLLALAARPLIPWLESAQGTRYLVEETTIIAERPILMRPPEEVTVNRQPLRDTSDDYNVALLAALLIATPGWSWRQLGRTLAWSLGLLVVTELVSLLVTIEYTKLWPTKTEAGIVLSTDYSRAKLILFDWLYAFFEFMGRGFFALIIYLGALAFLWGRPSEPPPAHAVGRNAPCPCGSGLKAKRCCGA